ncbi:hypothetical protein LEMA_P075810.1 [Plenodomus lingam JN3]|uniref:4a-hydroxytetrahydrobiopterin dehydratase n=1 Tax=Leptosphaeria maculans (strain JN3 / isolate v23.1.3 / race Av1-4-5-6-7-8) TaxID=985895 RepID=E5A8P7_LEPMJ|nr:hypothetical protein LEMA_P075810.1 [Plenodomus lingam JN3]CBX99992.1 hypothetical protein LEMA_P075810.1 [Plenodomus lingam JN3]
MTHVRLLPQAIPRALRVSSHVSGVTGRWTWCPVDAYTPSRHRAPLFVSPAWTSSRSISTADASTNSTAGNLSSSTAAENEEEKSKQPQPRLSGRELRTAMSGLTIPEGQPPQVRARVQDLICFSEWKISHDGRGLSRKYLFRNFDDAWKFMTMLVDEFRAKKHHPDWTNNNRKVKIRWTSHSPSGVTMKDVEMAELSDEIAHSIMPQNRESV